MGTELDELDIKEEAKPIESSWKYNWVKNPRNIRDLNIRKGFNSDNQ